MKCARMSISLRLAAFLALLLVQPCLFAQSGDPYPVVSYSTDPSDRILVYGEIPEMLADPDLLPLIQVYGDGTVWVHYPVYMKKAGDYIGFLNHGQLKKLLRDISAIYELDSSKLKKKKKDVMAQRISNGELFYRSDDVLELFEVQLEFWQPDVSANSGPLKKQFHWKNIVYDAELLPEIDELQALAHARARLLELLKLKNLVQVDSVPSQLLN